MPESKPKAFGAAGGEHMELKPSRKFLVTLEPDETGMIVAECPAIPGCVSQGETEAVPQRFPTSAFSSATSLDRSSETSFS
jgi:hypothetical protein